MYTLEKESVKQAYVLPGGERVPSVTTVLKILFKEGLLSWANKLGLKGKVLDNSGDSFAIDVGRLVHYKIECFAKDEEPDIDSTFDEKAIKKAEQIFEVFLKYFEDRHATVRNSELVLMDANAGYGGTLDLLVDTDTGLEFWDFKTSREIYREHYLQVSAYDKLLQINAFFGHKPRIVLLTKSGQLYAPDIPKGVIIEAGLAWDATLEAYKHLRKFEKELAT